MPAKPISKNKDMKTKKKSSKSSKPISNVGGGQAGILSSFGQASGQTR